MRRVLACVGLFFACACAYAHESAVDTQEALASARIGVCSWSWRAPLIEVADAMAGADVTGVHLALGPFISPDARHGAAETRDAWAFVRERVRSGAWHVMSTMIGFIGEDYTTLESIRATGGLVPDAHWDANRRIVREGLWLTRELGCTRMSLHAGFMDESDIQAYATFVERVRWVRDEARKFGITILLETGQETAEDLARFLAAVPGVAVNFDPANMVLYGKGDPVKAVRILRPWIEQVHVKDALFAHKKGAWGAEVPWGEGQVDAARLIAALEESGYRGNYVVEREGGSRRTRDIVQAVDRLRLSSALSKRP